MAGFFEEVKRRKVYRAAVAYVVVAAGVIQLASAVFPAWELPPWSLRLVIVLLLAGFPIALILAWALEVTPEGIRPIDLIDGLLSRPGWLTVALLKTLPFWDPLRDHPRFSEVIKKHGG